MTTEQSKASGTEDAGAILRAALGERRRDAQVKLELAQCRVEALDALIKKEDARRLSETLVRVWTSQTFR